jgi:hypothetical protein
MVESASRTSSADGDGSKLRDHAGHYPFGERGLDQRIVRRHALHVHELPDRIDREHMLQPADVESTAARRGTIAEQIGRWFSQPHLACRAEGVGQLRFALGVTR